MRNEWDIKSSTSNCNSSFFVLKLGQINTLNKLIKNDRMPILRNLCILPRMVSQERDEELEVRILMVNTFKLNVGKWPNILYKFKQEFQSMFGHFSTLYLKGLKDYISVSSSQPAFACSKLTTETLEQGVKYG